MALLLHGTEPGTAPTWITAIAPTPEELARLRDELGFDGSVLAHALDPNERPRVKTVGGTTFVVLRAPCAMAPGALVPYATAPLGVVVGRRCGLTIAAREGALVRKLAADADRGTGSELQHHIVLRALELTAEDFLARLDEVNAAVDVLEERLQRSLGNREVLALLRYQKCLVHFTAVLESTHAMLERIQKIPAFRVDPEDAEWVEDVLVEFRQALDTSAMSRNVMGEMMDAFASIISNNLNAVMKFLAAATVVLTFPVLVASFWGMNVALPLARAPHAFALLLAGSAALSLVVALYFHRRGWL